MEGGGDALYPLNLNGLIFMGFMIFFSWHLFFLSPKDTSLADSEGSSSQREPLPPNKRDILILITILEYLRRRPLSAGKKIDPRQIPVTDAGFRRREGVGGGGHQSQRGTPTYDLANFRQKLHENEEIWAGRGTSAAPPKIRFQ